MSEEKKHLEALYQHVHQRVRALKMGEAGSIPCNREFPADEVRQYLFGYATHKDKWFKPTLDRVSNVIHVVRVPVPVAPTGLESDEKEVR